ncbi:MAG TPA: hypothetical protein VGK87_07820 [Anaerolineae bacterium]|jgi:ATP/maltotriose-dependent transcriptional regulator MalT
MREPDFDVTAAHRYFSAFCFNSAWDLIDKKDRTLEEDEQMLRLSLASMWHWTQRPDCTNQNLSIGYWQTARIYALLRQPDNARRYANLCLAASQNSDVGPFYRAFACEALARAEAAAGNRELAAQHVEKGRAYAAEVTLAGDKKLVLADLDTVLV